MKIPAQPAIATTTGMGYSHMRNGNRSLPQRRCSKIKSHRLEPTNWMMHRIARMARITSLKFSDRQKKIAVAPSASREMCGKSFRRMHARENRKEISIQRRRVRHARIAQHRRKHRPERRHQDQPRCKRRPLAPVHALDKRADDELSFSPLPCHGITLKMLVCIAR